MAICAVEITLFAAGSRSLKDKRQILRSLLDKVKHRYNVSISEMDAMDLHQKLVIGVACISNSDSHARAVIDEVIRFVENNADAEVIGVVEINDSDAFG